MAGIYHVSSSATRRVSSAALALCKKSSHIELSLRGGLFPLILGSSLIFSAHLSTLRYRPKDHKVWRTMMATLSWLGTRKKERLTSVQWWNRPLFAMTHIGPTHLVLPQVSRKIPWNQGPICQTQFFSWQQAQVFWCYDLENDEFKSYNF